MTIDELRDQLAEKVIDRLSTSIPSRSEALVQDLKIDLEILRGILHQLLHAGKARIATSIQGEDLGWLKGTGIMAEVASNVLGL